VNVLATKRQDPVLPTVFRGVLTALPSPVTRDIIERVLNRLFAVPLSDGELQFLDGRTVAVSVNDANLRFSLSLKEGKLRAGPYPLSSDLEIRGSGYSFLQLASGAEDSDTLFFRRRISTTGDTELGLYVKNFLEGVDPGTLPLQSALESGLKLALITADKLEDLRVTVAGLLARLRPF